jgi:hypothetical protein
MISPLADNTTYQINHVNASGVHEVVGFVFASPGSSSLVDQEQRWVLYQSYFRMINKIKLGEGDSITLRAPPAEQRFKSLDDWIVSFAKGNEITNSVWRDGATYVKVNAKNYSAIPQTIEPPPVPLGSSRLEPKPVLQREALGQPSPSASVISPVPPTQLIDDMVAEIYRLDDADNATRQGAAGGGVLAPIGDGPTKVNVNVEHWVSHDHYVSQLGDGVPSLRLVISWKPTLADKYVRSQWAIGSTFTVTTCAYFTELPGAL